MSEEAERRGSDERRGPCARDGCACDGPAVRRLPSIAIEPVSERTCGYTCDLRKTDLLPRPEFNPPTLVELDSPPSSGSRALSLYAAIINN